MSFATALALFASASASIPDTDDIVFVSRTNIPAENVGERDLRVARKFAACLTIPRFPTDTEFSAKLRKCEKRLPRRPSDGLQDLIDRVREVVRNDAGSEATLTVGETIKPSKPVND